MVARYDERCQIEDERTIHERNQEHILLLVGTHEVGIIHETHN